MLSSQIAMVSQTPISPAILQSSIATSTALLRSSGTLPRRPRSPYQIRTLRIGLWSSYLDPGSHKEVQRRHRIMEYKYMEALNRKLSWECRNPISIRHFGFKGVMYSAWRGQDLRPARRCVNIDESNKARDDHQTYSKGIEDVEQSAFDKLLDSCTNWRVSAKNAIKPMLKSSNVQRGIPRRTTYGQEGFRKRFQHFQNQHTPGPELEYEIDPITNRKVFKNKSSENTRKPIDVPAQTFRGYQSQFEDFAPPACESTKAELKTYTPPSGIPPNSTAGSDENSNSIRKTLKDYEGDRNYKPFFRNELDQQQPESRTESLNEYDGKSSYEASRWYSEEKKGLEKSCPVQEGLRDYDSRTVYGPVMYREPDGQLAEGFDRMRDGLEDYENKNPYGAVRYREPDGKLPEETCPVQESLKDYDSKVTYGPVMHNEPNGKPPPKRDTVAEGLRNFDKRAEYGPRRILKNISLDSKGGSTDKSFRYPNQDTTEDLDLLRPSDVRAASGIIKGTKKESEAEKHAMRSKLEDDFKKQEAIHALKSEFPTIAEMKQQVQAMKDKAIENIKIKHSELSNVHAHIMGRVNAELQNISAELSTMPEQQKMTTSFVRGTPEEFEAKWTSTQDSESLKPEKETCSQEMAGHVPKEAFPRNSKTPRIETPLDPTSTVGAKVTDELTRLQNEIDPYSKEPKGLETSYAEEVAKENKLQIERDPYSKIPQGLEISYAEEVKIQNEKDPYSKRPVGLETSFAEEVAAQQAEEDLSSQVSFGRENETKENIRVQNLAKQSKRNLMKQMDKDLVREIRSIYEEEYGILDSKHRMVPGRSTVTASDNTRNIGATLDAQEPSIYKILAYDPTMQEINTAETTSIVPDSASALTPAEVLLRLSNPAKFFPHFQTLQSQGYEIISGSGDVLVFRKVRSAGLQGSKSESSSTQDRNRKITNPIDGMQGSPVAATGNFASPTGFVNHDLPVSDPPFKSNIDVRREEPVFSGKSTWQEESESTRRKGKGRGKRLLIGAAWVAGCSYAIGVVAEFFRTGGMDGLGTKGF